MMSLKKNLMQLREISSYKSLTLFPESLTLFPVSVFICLTTELGATRHASI